MSTAEELTWAYIARADHPFWQRCLRRSARLYLALDEPGLDTPALKAGLRLIELELCWYLVGSSTPSRLALEAAQTILEMARDTLFGDRDERAALLRDISVAQYQRPTMRQEDSASGCWYASAA